MRVPLCVVIIRSMVS